MGRRGAFPGSFDPLTIAHVGIADAARRQCDLDVVELVISVDPLGKDAAGQSPVADRLDRIRAVRDAGRPWLGAVTTVRRFLAEIAGGYDVLVVGADKWHQLHDTAFYDGDDHKESMLARLPTLAVVPRAGVSLPHDLGDAVVLDVDDRLAEVSSTAVRDGADHWRA